MAAGGDAAVLRRAAHQALHAVGDDLDHLRFNRAIARIYELANAIQAGLQRPAEPGLDRAIREISRDPGPHFCPDDAAFGRGMLAGAGL